VCCSHSLTHKGGPHGGNHRVVPPGRNPGAPPIIDLPWGDYRFANPRCGPNIFNSPKRPPILDASGCLPFLYPWGSLLIWTLLGLPLFWTPLWWSLILDTPGEAPILLSSLGGTPVLHTHVCLPFCAPLAGLSILHPPEE
jgi:hypothetical protein